MKRISRFVSLETKNAMYNFQRKYTRWRAFFPATFISVLMPSKIHLKANCKFNLSFPLGQPGFCASCFPAALEHSRSDLTETSGSPFEETLDLAMTARNTHHDMK